MRSDAEGGEASVQDEALVDEAFEMKWGECLR